MDTKVVLIFGQTGIEKTQCAEKIAASFLGLSDTKFLTRHPSTTFSLEKEIEKVEGVGANGIHYFITSAYENRQKEAWARAAETIVDIIAKGKPTIAVITLHAVYYYSSHYKPLITFDFLKTLNPYVCFTFMNDIFDIKHNIDNNEANQRFNIDLTMEEIINWRMVELMVANFVLENTGLKLKNNYLISTRQMTKTIVDIINDKDDYKIYLSFPITKTRGEGTRRALINEVREGLHADFICFDPLGIDEKRFIINEDNASIDIYPRWEFGLTDTLCEGTGGFDLKKQLKTTNEASRLLEIIGNHITFRDRFLIEQSDAVVVCRPFSSINGLPDDGEITSGVAAEITHAQSFSKPVLLFEDKKPKEKHIGKTFPKLQGVEIVTDFDVLKQRLMVMKSKKKT